ncbi:EsV-1-117 [Ectocarpus siliculosus]|uniref:EsV-1-117 n=1 Tax=Ectocarpus siliculosus TaxID=2880 RepID=D8LPE5_ECTSI|nr:EsV-1-117 [Ectocarpus siliculosus]|eukprot:CBN80417.1 EsV-1-117 [Ectocarpus siliculosus]
MDVLKTFVFDNTEHVVDIQVVDDKPMFKADQIGKIIGLKQMRSSVRHFDRDEKVVQRMHTRGGEQDCTFLTEMGAYRLLMRSDKPMARPFQKWVAHVIATIRETGKYELSKQLDDLKGQNDNEKADLVMHYKSQHETETHDVLLGGFANKKVVYYGKIADLEDGTSLIKIGSTANIKQRVGSLRYGYGSFTVFRVFECQEHNGFEKFLHQHVDIKRYKKPTYNGIVSTETYAMNDGDLKRAINIAIRNVVQYRRDTEQIRDIKEIVEDVVQAEVAKVLGEKRKARVSEEAQHDSKRGHNTTLGSKIQIYAEDGGLVKTFNRLIDTLRNDQWQFDEKVYRAGVLKACEGDFIYAGYRWMQLDRNLDDDTVQQLRPTILKKNIHKGWVALLSSDESEVAELYPDFKTAAEQNGFLSLGALQKRRKKGDKIHGHVIRPWSECGDELQKLYRGTFPDKTIGGKHIRVLKMDPVTKEVLHEYETINEVMAKIRCAHRTLKSAIAKGVELRGYLWKFAS